MENTFSYFFPQLPATNRIWLTYILLCEVKSFDITWWIFLSFIHIICNILLFCCNISLLFAIFYLHFVFVLASIKFKALTISSEGEKVLENFWGKNLIRWGWRWGRAAGAEIQFWNTILCVWIISLNKKHHTLDSGLLSIEPWARCRYGKLCGWKIKYFCAEHTKSFPLKTDSAHKDRIRLTEMVTTLNS